MTVARTTDMVQKMQKDNTRGKRHRIMELIGGEILDNDFFRRQAKLLALIVVLVIFYVHNRYACQQQLIEVNELHQVLTDIKYRALTRESELVERSRQSRIEEFVERDSSDLQTATNPPYLIK